MKPLHFLLTFLVLLISYVLMHVYAANWLIRNFVFFKNHSRWTERFFLVLSLLPVLAMSLRHNFGREFLEPLYFVLYLWMGIILIWISLIILSDAATLTAKLFKLQPIKYSGTIVITLLVIFTTFSIHEALKIPSIKRIALKIPELPENLNGMKIAQIADMHIDGKFKLKKFKKILKILGKENPDLLVFTGDMIESRLKHTDESSTSPLPNSVSLFFESIKPKYGIYGVLGNHEFISGLKESIQWHEKSGIRLLRNELIDLGDFQIAGVDDIRMTYMTDYVFESIFKYGNPQKFGIFLSHQPLKFEKLANHGKWLMLSGHIHRGQIFPFGFFVRLFYKYFYGLYKEKDSYLYVTSGTDAWGPPMRFLAPAEIPVITLHK